MVSIVASEFAGFLEELNSSASGSKGGVARAIAQTCLPLAVIIVVEEDRRVAHLLALLLS